MEGNEDKDFVYFVSKNNNIKENIKRKSDSPQLKKKKNIQATAIESIFSVFFMKK